MSSFLLLTQQYSELFNFLDTLLKENSLHTEMIPFSMYINK